LWRRGEARRLLGLNRAMVRSALLLAALLAASAQARPEYDLELPNADKFSRGQQTKALGHSVRVPAVDAFGTAFRQAGRKWTLALCRADSDNDGISNGRELGDPDCTWTRANPSATTLLTAISDPGNRASVPVVTPPPPTPQPTLPPTTGNPTVAGAPPTSKPTLPPTFPPTPGQTSVVTPGLPPVAPPVADDPSAVGTGAGGTGAGGSVSDVAAAGSAGTPSVALIAVAGVAGALVVLAVINNNNRKTGQAAMARWHAEHGLQAMNPRRSGQPGAGVEVVV
jgi:hypothetical protein